MWWVMLENLVRGLLNISVQAAVIFCVLFLARAVFSLCRIPKKYACFLWMILFARLLMPIQPESPVGLWVKGDMPQSFVENTQAAGEGNASVPEESQGIENGNVPTESQGTGNENALTGLQGIGHESAPTDPQGDGNMDAAGGRLGTGDIGILERLWRTEAVNGAGGLPGAARRILSLVWGLGCLGFLLYGGISCLLLKKRLRCSIRREDNCYLVDGIPTAFVMGVFPPRIYVPSELEGDDLAYVILHERIHIQRKDYLVKAAAYLITCIYWFHPLVWAALVCMGKDIELACDEAVLGKLGESSRRGYADTLLRLSDGKRCHAGVPLAFGEGDTENRIRHIVKYRKPAVAAAVLAVILLSGLAVSLLTGRPGEQPDALPAEGGQREENKEPDALPAEGGQGGENRESDASPAEGGQGGENKEPDALPAEGRQGGENREPNALPAESGQGEENDKSIGANSPDSINSRFPEPVELPSGHIVTVTGDVYHITISIDGDTYRMEDLCSMVNALMEIQEFGEYIVVDGHISPDSSYYGFYSTESKQWVLELTGALLTWDENWETLENPIESVIYAGSFDERGVIYDWKGNQIAVIDLEEEYIYGLKRVGDDITVTVVDYTGKSREVHF